MCLNGDHSRTEKSNTANPGLSVEIQSRLTIPQLANFGFGTCHVVSEKLENGNYRGHLTAAGHDAANTIAERLNDEQILRYI